MQAAGSQFPSALRKAMQAFFKRVAAGEKPGFPRARQRQQFFTLCCPAAYRRFEGKRLILPTGGKGQQKASPISLPSLTKCRPVAFAKLPFPGMQAAIIMRPLSTRRQKGRNKQVAWWPASLRIKTLAVGYNGRGRFYYFGGFEGYRWYVPSS
jgi:putative transposase